MKLVGANPNAVATGGDELPGKTNYFIGNNPKKWRTNVPTYAKVKYKGVYPGIDLVYYGNQGGRLEYDFVVAPGAGPNVIALDVGVGSPRRLPAQGRPQGSPPHIASLWMTPRTGSTPTMGSYQGFGKRAGTWVGRCSRFRRKSTTSATLPQQASAAAPAASKSTCSSKSC